MTLHLPLEPIVIVLLAALRSGMVLLLLPIAGGYSLFSFAFQRLPAHGWFGTLQGFVRRNDLSYGVYIYGWPVQQILISLLQLRSPWLLMPLALTLAAACAFVSWHVVEKPFLRLKPKAG